MERWLPVVGFEGAYEVSDLGRVRSLDRVIQRPCWDKYAQRHIVRPHRLRGRVLEPYPQGTGHLYLLLGRRRRKFVHHLVLEAFVGPRPPKPFEGIHADDNPSNNQLSNLRWGTRSSNLHDAVRNGGRAIGERAHNAKLRNADIPVIRSLLGKRRIARIAAEYGVNESTIRQIRDRKAWRHIPEAAHASN